MDDLGKIQKLKKFMESHGCDFPEDVNYRKRMNKKSKFTSVPYFYVYLYLQTTFVVQEPRIAMPWTLSRSATWMTLSKQPTR